jgi:hypothetical protein
VVSTSRLAAGFKMILVIRWRLSSQVVSADAGEALCGPIQILMPFWVGLKKEKDRCVFG